MRWKVIGETNSSSETGADGFVSSRAIKRHPRCPKDSSSIKSYDHDVCGQTPPPDAFATYKRIDQNPLCGRAVPGQRAQGRDATPRVFDTSPIIFSARLEAAWKPPRAVSGRSHRVAKRGDV